MASGHGPVWPGPALRHAAAGRPLASTHVGGDVIATRAADLHDMLTGSSPDGRAVNDGKDNTCGDWTKSGEG